ncbi:TonB-dependent siderophore receptor [Roseateles sp. BYS180W]|uniref:TonB-dependent siderophore receptor n=1 Tax=Roseateles rivi TaxID=3299028 RepID=A0ABW7FT43_9BURK
MLASRCNLRPSRLAWAAGLTWTFCAAAQAQNPPPAEQELPVLKARAAQDDSAGRATTTTKGETRLLELPQSISVVTRERIDQTQAKSLAEALSGVAGVVAGERGRRGFDDIGIRGQIFGQEKFVDGLMTMRPGYMPAEELFGAERVEVLKGPASLLFGSVRPGGMVNVVSKRPQREAFTRLALNAGSHGFKEATLDVGRSFAQQQRHAWRVAALVNDSDDETDHVFFRNAYVAPSLQLQLGEATQLTLLSSYQDRAWLRNQGLPPKGTVLPNKNGPVRRELYLGDPSLGHNDTRRTRLGWELQHQLNSAWSLHQNARWDDSQLTQRVAAYHATLAADERTQARTGTLASDDQRALALDTHMRGRANSPLGRHSLTLGLDLAHFSGRSAANNCSTANLGTQDLYTPSYGRFSLNTVCTGAARDNSELLRSAGLYARDQLHLDAGLVLTYGLRHDQLRAQLTDQRTAKRSTQGDSATTGMLGVVYEMAPGWAPYASLANSFVPVVGSDRAGRAFVPERGRQIEGGIKYEGAGGRQSASFALYDLRRQNVLTPDPVNAGFNVQDGEHRSRGLELEAGLALAPGWRVNAAYGYTDAEVSRSNNAAERGRRVNNVPRHSLSAWSQYDIVRGPLAGVGVGLGLRGMSQRRGYSYDFAIPGYAVLDAALRYQGPRWGVALNVRNLTDKTVYGGALNNNVVTLGDTRQLRLSVNYSL